MTRQKTLILIPLVIVAGLLIYCWTTILTTDLLANWRHYTGLILFLVLAFLFFKSITKTIPATGIFLLLATHNLLAFTPRITTYSFGLNIGPGLPLMPPIQFLSLGLFVFYFILNQNSLINIYLDYKEAKELKAQAKTAKSS
jgi:hypothetical protein